MPEIKKTVLFFPLNTPGHINSSLGFADIMKRNLNCHTIFLLLGDMIGTSIEDHGHELITLEESNPYKDFEIEDDENPCEPVDEEAKIQAGKSKRSFKGVLKWPQLIRRYSNVFRLDPVDAFVASAEIMERAMVGELIENHDHYARAIAAIKPDLLIIDAYYVPPCVLKLNVPWVRLYSANPLALIQSKLPDGVKPAPMIGAQLFTKDQRKLMRKEEPEKWKAILQQWRDTERKIVDAMSKAGGLLNEFIKKHQCEPVPPGKQAHDSPYLNVYMYPEALDYAQDDDLFEYPKLWLRCDSLVRQQPQSGTTEAKELDCWRDKFAAAADNKQTVVFFSLGSIASGDSNIMKRFVGYMRSKQEILFIVSKGVNGDKFELDERNMIGANFIPQTYFLEQADLAIIHGGNNSVTECMYYGKPMIVLPVFADQFDNAQRVEDLGYGRHLDIYKCNQKQLLLAIDDILDDKMLRDRMRSISKKMQSNQNLKKVAEILLKLANEGSLSQEEIDKCRV